MAWTTEIVEKTKDARVLVRFVEDITGFFADQVIDPRFLDAEIRAAIVRYDALISRVIGSYTPAPLPPPPTPDPDKPDLQTFAAAVELAENYQRLITIGSIAANDADFVALRNQIKDFLTAHPLIKTKLIRSI